MIFQVAGDRPRGFAALNRASTSGLALILAACALTACSHLPESGPPTQAVLNGAKAPPGLNYYLVPVSPQVLSIINERRGRELAHVFADGHPAPMQAIGVGDTISVTIWENSGLFGVAQTIGKKTDLGAVSQTPSDSTAVTLPSQVVGQSGDINIPFAGRIPAAGLTPAQVEREILTAIKGNTIAPQVLVTVTENGSNFVTVTGDVNHPGRVPLSIGGTRLLDAVAVAGGATAQTSDIAVQLTREGVTRRVRLDTVVREPTEDIYLRTGDLVYLVKEPQSAVILGATEKNAEVSFGKSGMSLAEVVGNAGGLSDSRADPYGVFVFRYEPVSLVRSLGPETIEPDPNDQVPVVYEINMKSPVGYFVAQSFAIHDQDLVYVANTESVQLSKLADLVHEFTAFFQPSSYYTKSFVQPGN
jgi:polysaccharide export outer membrane protein